MSKGFRYYCNLSNAMYFTHNTHDTRARQHNQQVSPIKWTQIEIIPGSTLDDLSPFISPSQGHM